jgi:hypothetical protein
VVPWWWLLVVGWIGGAAGLTAGGLTATAARVRELRCPDCGQRVRPP